MLNAPISEKNDGMTRSSATSTQMSAWKGKQKSGGTVGFDDVLSALGSRSIGSPSVRHQVMAKAQSTYGNQAVLRMLNRSFNSATPILQRKCNCGGAGGDCAACNEKKESTLQRLAGHQAEPS